MLYVLQADANPTDPDVTFEISGSRSTSPINLGICVYEAQAGQGGFGFYDAVWSVQDNLQVHRGAHPH